MSEVLEIFPDGTEVHILKYGKIIDIARVVRDKRSEIEVESLQANPGSRRSFAYMPDCGAWRILIEGLGGERCFSERSPFYAIARIA